MSTPPVGIRPPDLAGACAPVGEDLGWSLGVLFRALLKAANTAAGDIPGGQRGYHVLTVAAEGSSGTQLALAQQLGVDRTVMTYLLDDLEQAGLIERQPDPADRRARRIVITESGRALHQSLQQQMLDVADQVLCGLAPLERAAFRQLIGRAALRLAEVDPPPGGCAIVEEIAESGGTSAKPPAARRPPRR